MAGRKAATVSRETLAAMSVPDALLLRARVDAGQGSDADKELLQRLLAFWRGRYNRGALSEKTARQLGIA